MDQVLALGAPYIVGAMIDCYSSLAYAGNFPVIDPLSTAL